ncbi:MAG: hypothetical protein IBX63_11105 [Coriobacteriia bacterium]|nr:hypothetical protein [Coriobacteriia bacterium]
MGPLTALSRVLTGALLANGIPHFVNGVSGRAFPTPFASPPAVGLSSPLVNVIWAVLNFAIAYVLLSKARRITGPYSLDALLLAIGFIATAVGLAVVFG